MIGLSEYINEAVAIRTTGKYDIWGKRISENSVWSDFTMTFSAMGAKEIDIDLTDTWQPSDQNILTRMFDWYGDHTEKRPVFSFVMARYYKTRIFFLTRDGIGYSISLKGGRGGIEVIAKYVVARYSHNNNLKTVTCTEVGDNKGGINRMLSDIKDILENETK